MTDHCSEHTAFAEKIGSLTAQVKNVSADVGEIKRNVALLVTHNAQEKGFRIVGRAFAVGIGVATPLAAFLWATMGKG